jgi:hypothetical protein
MDIEQFGTIPSGQTVRRQLDTPQAPANFVMVNAAPANFVMC